MTDVSDSPMMSPVGAPATPVTNGLDSPAPFTRVVSLPISSHEIRSPTLHRPASSLPTIAPVLSRSAGLDAALKKLQAGLTTRTGEYCKRVLACTNQLQSQWAVRHNKKPATPTASNDILEFSGVPYTSPVEPDLPTSPSNTIASLSQSSSIQSPAAAPLSPSRHHSGTFLSPTSLPHPAPHSSYISDLCVHHKLNKKSQPPDGYVLLDRTISGLYRAQINRNNNNHKLHIGFKRSTTSSPPPITSVSVFFRDIKEEAPFNFVAVERNTTGGDGCLHPNSSARQPYLAFSRGEGAPLTHISLISRQHKEALPAGWHEVKVTLSGDKKADISGGNTEGAVYVCFRVDVRPIMSKWRQALDDFEQHTPKAHSTNSSPSPSSFMSPPSPAQDVDDDEQHLFPYYVRLFALLSSLLYSYDSKLILFAFDVYRKLQSQHIPPQLLNLFLSCVCDATPLFLTYFQSTQHSSLLKWLLQVFKASLPVLSVDVLIKCVEVCLLLRHEDKQAEVSEAMITRVLDAVTDIHAGCTCHNKAADTAGVDGDDYKDSGGNTPAVPQSPSSNNSSMLAGGSNTQLCYHCANRHFRAFLPIPQLAESIVRQLATNIAIQHALGTNVRTYRRHHTITPHFRSDVRDIIARLMALDEPAIRERRVVQGMLGSLGLGGGGAGEGGRGKFSFSSIRAGDIAPEVKEETEESVRGEDTSPTPPHTGGDTTRDNTPPSKVVGTIVINLDTPSKLPSQENNTTLVNDDTSRTPSPTETKDERKLNGGNGASFLLPPDRGSSDDEETSMSYSGSGSRSEFLYPEFHVRHSALTTTCSSAVAAESPSHPSHTAPLSAVPCACLCCHRRMRLSLLLLCRRRMKTTRTEMRRPRKPQPKMTPSPARPLCMEPPLSLRQSAWQRQTSTIHTITRQLATAARSRARHPPHSTPHPPPAPLPPRLFPPAMRPRSHFRHPTHRLSMPSRHRVRPSCTSSHSY